MNVTCTSSRPARVHPEFACVRCKCEAVSVSRWGAPYCCHFFEGMVIRGSNIRANSRPKKRQKDISILFIE